MTTQQIIGGLAVCMAFGLVAGAIAWDVLVAEPLRTKLEREHGLRVRWQIRAQTRHQGTPYRVRGEGVDLKSVEALEAFADNDRWSRRAGLRSVQ